MKRSFGMVGAVYGAHAVAVNAAVDAGPMNAASRSATRIRHNLSPPGPDAVVRLPSLPIDRVPPHPVAIQPITHP